MQQALHVTTLPSHYHRINAGTSARLLGTRTRLKHPPAPHRVVSLFLYRGGAQAKVSLLCFLHLFDDVLHYKL
jgi:hypothetical protein